MKKRLTVQKCTNNNMSCHPRTLPSLLTHPDRKQTKFLLLPQYIYTPTLSLNPLLYTANVSSHRRNILCVHTFGSIVGLIYIKQTKWQSYCFTTLDVLPLISCNNSYQINNEQYHVFTATPHRLFNSSTLWKFNFKLYLILIIYMQFQSCEGLTIFLRYLNI